MHLTHGYSATSFLLNVWTIFSIKNTTFCPYELARQLGGTGSDFGYLISNPIPFLERKNSHLARMGQVGFEGILLTSKTMFYIFSRE